MRRGLDDPAPHHRRHGQADRAAHVEVPQDLVDNGGDGLRRGRRRGIQPDSLDGELTCCDVNGRNFNAGPPDVDPDDGSRCHSCAHFPLVPLPPAPRSPALSLATIPATASASPTAGDRCSISSARSVTTTSAPCSFSAAACQERPGPIGARLPVDILLVVRRPERDERLACLPCTLAQVAVEHLFPCGAMDLRRLGPYPIQIEGHPRTLSGRLNMPLTYELEINSHRPIPEVHAMLSKANYLHRLADGSIIIRISSGPHHALNQLEIESNTMAILLYPAARRARGLAARTHDGERGHLSELLRAIPVQPGKSAADLPAISLPN